MNGELEVFLQYVHLFLTGSNLRDTRENLVNQELISGDNVDFFDSIQGYFEENYWNFHIAVYDEIDMFMAQIEIPKFIREKFASWYSALGQEDDFEFIQSCFLSMDDSEFFSYGTLKEIAVLNRTIGSFSEDELLTLKTTLSEWISSQNRKDFIEVTAREHLDALNELAQSY